jgi:outer membrane protein TolC
MLWLSITAPLLAQTKDAPAARRPAPIRIQNQQSQPPNGQQLQHYADRLQGAELEIRRLRQQLQNMQSKQSGYPVAPASYTESQLATNHQSPSFAAPAQAACTNCRSLAACNCRNGRRSTHAPFTGLLPEQRSISIRPPSHLPTQSVSQAAQLDTVAMPVAKSPIHISLDDALSVAIRNSEVIRVLGGNQATSSGSTIYDAAISNTAIDDQQATFDPFISWNHSFNRTEFPSALLDPMVAELARIDGSRTDGYNMTAGLTKKTMSGATVDFGVNTNPTRSQLGLFALNPQNRHSLDLSVTQPLYRGGGIGANRAAIIVARIDTERSFFQYKDAVQEMVRGVIEAYWSLVSVRTERWAREQQVKQARFAYEQAEGRFQAGTVSRGIVAQARVSLGNFKNSMLLAQNNVIQREAALRNILGLPPVDGKELIPTTSPTNERVKFKWDELLAIAEANRPDIVQLKLALQSDEQQVLLARNRAMPTIDASALYRWNGLNGRTPSGADISTSGGENTDWAFGVNFSVPLTLRQERATLRRQELIVARDRAHLRQGIHGMVHSLATDIRSLEQFYLQYQELHDIRNDARLNLQERRERWSAGGVGGISFVDFLLAITDWGNTVSQEAQLLASYNTQLASIERATGTILESHGIRFYEEQNCQMGPWGSRGKGRMYPSAMRPSSNEPRYGTDPNSREPAERFFQLDDPLLDSPLRENLGAE